MSFFEQFTACLASKLFNSYPQICSFNQGVTPPTKNRTQKHTIHLFKCTLLLQVEGSSLIYRNTKDVETIVFTWSCFVFFLCESISVLSSFLWLHLLLSSLTTLNGKVKHHKSSLSVFFFMLGNYTQSAGTFFGPEHSDGWNPPPHTHTRTPS